MKGYSIDDLIYAINVKNGFSLSDVRKYRKELRLLGDFEGQTYSNYDELMISGWLWNNYGKGFDFWQGLWEKLRKYKVEGFI